MPASSVWMRRSSDRRCFGPRRIANAGRPVSIRRIGAAIGLMAAVLLAPAVTADEPAPAASLSARLAVLRERQFHRLWPSAALPGRPADALLEELRARLAAQQPWPLALQAARLEADLGTSPDAAALLAAAAASSGLTDTARGALARAAGAGRLLLAAAALAVAERLLTDGAPDAALDALRALPVRLERRDRHRLAMIKAGAQFALGRPREAAQSLQAAEFDPLRLVGASAAERLDAAVLQYDLGIALIRSGATARGHALLERLGRSDSIGDEPQAQALRDRANLGLAAEFLAAGQGATARALFERVALEGPYSNRALLGMGWASLGPQGDPQSGGLNLDSAGTRSTPKFVLRVMQRRRLIDCENYNRRALAPTELCSRQPRFEQAKVPERVESLAEEAIAVWQELSAREPRDPTVREAWGALGHAAARAGLRGDAIAGYEAAAAHLDAALAANQDASRRVAAEGLAAGWAALPTASETSPALAPGNGVPAATLIRFEAALGVDAAPESAARRQLLAEHLEARWLQAEYGEDPALAELIDAQQQALTATVSMSLDGERRQLAHWLASVRAGLATLSDPSFVLPPPSPP